MPAEPSTLARDVDRLYREGTLSGLSESQLLERFLVRNDAMAFEALVTRHGPMVLAVCRRVLRNHHEADDAFQATFLVLVRKASTLRATLLGPWLHRVAYRVAIRAGKTQARRLARESTSSEIVATATAPAANVIDRETHRELHEALEGLPARYREPIILCDLEGQTHDEAARHLKWPIGSVKGRLSRGRDLLRARLERRGMGNPSLVLALAGEMKVMVPIALKQATVEAATTIAAGNPLTAGTLSATAVFLAREVLQAMMINKVAAIGSGVVAVVIAVGGTAAIARQDAAKPSVEKTLEPRGSVPAKESETPDQSPPAQEPSAANEPVARTGLQVARDLRAESEKLQYQRDNTLDGLMQAELRSETVQSRIDALQEVIHATELFEITGVSKPPAITLNNNQQRQAKLQEVRKAWELAIRELQSVRQEARVLARTADGHARQIDELNARADAAAARPGLPNTVQVGDLLVVEVLEALPGRPISGERVIRPDGTISLGFYGDLKVDGLTLREIKVKVIEHMNKYLTDEALGLIGQKEVAKGEFKTVEVAPVESDRLFVDRADYYDHAASPALKNLQRRFDEMTRELDALKRADRKDLRGTPRS